eukprot:CAMPEP_0182418960 /NCGR_PEP_ID=MMETSP1167-20130531/3341_1 /TAXON_ID=2988 /ORGANISM="Mallomonas Sp, Strain CCMP3275" /LENGTH=129 /DNA_ID=CAMNT_0024593473 /DNA_START=465 /DNA_END=851 /DNA_ORIENTATION=+
MNMAIAQKKFIEFAKVHGHMYGTSITAVDSVLQSNRVCLHDVDIAGVKQMKKLTSFESKYVFIAPPSLEDLETRLRGRATESEEQLQLRLGNAKSEIEYGNTEGNFDCIIVNKGIDESVTELSQLMEEW